MIEIVLYNLAFWSVWITLCSIPKILMQYAIDNHDQVPPKYLSGKNKKPLTSI